MGFEYLSNSELVRLNKVVEINKKVHYQASKSFFSSGSFDQCLDSMRADAVSIFDHWNEENSTTLKFPLNSNFD